MGEVQELLGFLSMETRADVRGTALELVLGITASQEKEAFFASHTGFIPAIVTIFKEEPKQPVVQDAIAALVNLAADEHFSQQMLSNSIVQELVKRILNPKEELPDPCCMLLTNLTRHEALATALCSHQTNGRNCLVDLIDVFCRSTSHNDKGSFHHLASVFFNVTQVNEGREQLMDKANGCLLQRLLPFTQFEDSKVRRGGVIGALRNCCFNSEVSRCLACEDVDILPNILLPLAGPEELDDDDMDGMLDDLQFLPPDKVREADPDIRKMLLESLLQLAALRESRDKMRALKVYPILRLEHLWEPEDDVRDICEQVVQLLIQEEHELSDNLHEVKVSDRAAQEFESIKQTIADGSGPELEFVPEKKVEDVSEALEDSK